MKTANWTPDEDRRLRRMVSDHFPIEVMARALGKSEMAVYLYAYRHRIPLRRTVKNPIMRKLVEVKFGDVEYFRPTRRFYAETGISQKRWAALMFGYAQPTQEELVAAARALRLSVEESLALMEARQLKFGWDDSL